MSVRQVTVFLPILVIACLRITPALAEPTESGRADEPKLSFWNQQRKGANGDVGDVTEAWMSAFSNSLSTKNSFSNLATGGLTG